MPKANKTMREFLMLLRNTTLVINKPKHKYAATIINLLLQFLIAQLVPKKRITALAKRDCIRVSEALRESSTNTSEVFSSHRKLSRARQHW